MKSVHWKYLLLTCVFAGFWYQIKCAYRIEFLKVCNNPQVQLIDCPTFRTFDIKPTRLFKRPSFVLGNTSTNCAELIGNFTFHRGRRRIHIIEMTLEVQGDTEDRKCFNIVQPVNREYVTMRCLRMVPSNFAQIHVRLYQNVSVCGNQTGSRCSKQLVQAASHSFNIGKESCRCFNKKSGVQTVRRFSGWADVHQTLEFHYFDSLINPFASQTEIVITESCVTRLSVLYNKTVRPGANRAVSVHGECKMVCPPDQHREIYAETCSYCHQRHEDSECFHQELQLREDLHIVSGCGECSVRATCIHERCVCGNGHHGDGYICHPNHRDAFPNGAILIAVFGTLIVVFILGSIKWISTKNVKCKKLKCLFSPQNHFQQIDIIYDKDQEILIQNNQVSTTKNYKNTILVLYHPDTAHHQQRVSKFVFDLQHKNYHVVGLPEDYQANWVEFAETIIQTVSDLFIILSPKLSHLCKLYKNKQTKTCSEETTLKTLLEERQHDCVPCVVMDTLQRRRCINTQVEQHIHMVSFQNNDPQCSSDLYSQFVGTYDFLKDDSFCHKIRHSTMNMSNVTDEDVDYTPLLSQLKAVPDSKS